MRFSIYNRGLTYFKTKSNSRACNMEVKTRNSVNHIHFNSIAWRYHEGACTPVRWGWKLHSLSALGIYNGVSFSFIWIMKIGGAYFNVIKKKYIIIIDEGACIPERWGWKSHSLNVFSIYNGVGSHFLMIVQNSYFINSLKIFFAESPNLSKITL